MFLFSVIDTPEFIESRDYGTAQVRLKCATEEHGPISHYWLVVIPGNYSKDHVINVDSQQLVQNTNRVRQLYNKSPVISGANGRSAQRRAINSIQEGHIDGVENTHPVEEGKIDLHVFANGHQLQDEDEEIEDDHQFVISRPKREVHESPEFEFTEPEHKVHHQKRKRRHNKKKREPAPPLNLPLIDGVYIGAQLTAQQLEQMQRRDETFTLGDGKVKIG